MKTMDRPAAHEHLPYYGKYIALVGEPDVLSLLARQPSELRTLAASVPPQLETYRYAPEKWTVRQVFGHLNDAERVFGYRAFRISRGDQTPLAGFDENTYAAQGRHDDVPLSELAEEFAQLRGANLAVLKRLDASRAALMGTANNAAISVRALAYIMAGHVRHHQQGLSANYGVGAPV
jgi:hypothetical protein